jgi:DNA-binding CsgD family transcriptional regulator
VPRLPTHTLAGVRAIESELGTLVDGGPPALAALSAPLGELLEADRPMAMVFGPRGDGVRVEQGYEAPRAARITRAYDAWLDGQRVGWTTYNPLRPEPDQRNVALDTARILRRMGVRDRFDVPIARDFFPRVGLGSHDNLRVLVCDGPSLLAWVGAFRELAFGDLERRALQRLVPALKRRLLVERTLAMGESTTALLDALFDAIPSPAFVTDVAGAVLEVNASGRLWLEREGRAGVEGLRVAARGRGDPRFAVTPIAGRGVALRQLLVMRPGAEPSGTSRAAAAAARWSLTRRQREVLTLLVDGLTTRTIAACLGVSERAVELCLTAMFEKAQVETRAELVARVWRGREG